MENNPALRAIVSRALRDPENPMSQTDLAAAMGHGRAWVSKLLNGTLKTITNAQAERLQEVLGIKLLALEGPKIPQLAVEIGKAMEQDEAFTKLLTAAMEFHEKQAVITEFAVPFVETKDMSRLGNCIISLAHADPDKGGKVMREVLYLLQEYANKRKERLEKDAKKD